MRIFTLTILLCLLSAIFGVGLVLANEYTSNDYKVMEPVMFTGGYSTSTSYQLFGALSQPSIGTSTASGFNLGGGFLYYP